MDAMTSMEPGCRKLTLRTSIMLNHEIEISVSDTGIGFPQEMADQLFNAFVTTKKDGVGLGLSICRTIAEAHGGAISAHSVLGQGATFTVILSINTPEAHYES